MIPELAHVPSGSPWPRIHERHAALPLAAAVFTPVQCGAFRSRPCSFFQACKTVRFSATESVAQFSHAGQADYVSPLWAFGRAPRAVPPSPLRLTAPKTQRLRHHNARSDAKTRWNNRTGRRMCRASTKLRDGLSSSPAQASPSS